MEKEKIEATIEMPAVIYIKDGYVVKISLPLKGNARIFFPRELKMRG